ncbi:gamma-aminobutyric acid type B receptor subunit 1-like isoform X3 [Paramacrobiotus metropolitanus]|uniref:gamma-aminobutyric acid type B receptor subunit 1-like isoform X2 n=1 Tax=Paramacrobiotus metropolitanus TaxID=2943436 RepID=UPI0024456A9C|nr:gamma-aminobutyric acid type B receptor subunit 1-like isoform X2 [Paramacrobiotus metropolitanus]XP_055338703.1 gamma-aminobutyric acid type B receptor subunit 1-like isoform X3 [Paramacrobiotus metropolitanus]
MFQRRYISFSVYALCILSTCYLIPICSCVKDLVLAGIFPITGKGGWAGGVGCYPAAQLALEHVNNHSGLLPGYHLTMHYNDSECEPGKGITILYDLLYNEPQKIMLLGPGCSTVTTTIAEAAKMWNLVVMSYGSSSPALSDRRRFTTFFRTHPSANLNNPAYIQLFKHYGWQKINIIQEAEEVFVSSVENLERLCKQNKIEVVTRQSFLKDPAEAVRNLNRSDARIIVGLFYEKPARLVFCEAYKNNLYGKRVVWLIIGWYADNWYEVDPDKDPDVNCTKEELKEALEGHLTAESLIRNSNNVSTLSGRTTEQFFNELGSRLTTKPTETPGYVEAPLAYDAVWAIALAFNRSIQELAKYGKLLEDFTYSDEFTSQVIYNATQNTEFEGVSGRVSFTSEGDRIAQTQIEQMQDGHYKILGYYDPDIDVINWENGRPRDRWIGGKPPRHETLKYPQFRIVERFLFWSMVTLAGFGIVLAICCLIFNFTHRMRRLIQLSHPNINNLMLFGIVLCLISVILLGLDKAFDTLITNERFYMLCQARAWILMTGFTLSYGSMFSKIWNVHRLSTYAKKESKREARRSAGRGSFRNNTSFAEIRTFSSLVQTQKVESWQLYIVVIALLVVDILILALWAGIHPMDLAPYKFPPEKATDTDEDIEYEPVLWQCASPHDTIWMGVIFAYKGLFLIFGLFLAYETRSVKIKELNDSRFVGMSIYNVVILCIITAPVSLIISRQHNAKFAFVALSIMFCSFLSMGLIFVPKIIEIYRRKTEHSDSKKLEDSIPSREEEEKYQKLLGENEELKKQIQEKEEKIKMLQGRIKDRASERARLTLEYQKSKEAEQNVSSSSPKQAETSGENMVVPDRVEQKRHSDSALPSSTGA